MKNFFGSAKNIELILFRVFELRWFQIWAQIFHIFHGSKVTALQSGSTLALLGRFSPSLQGCNFWSKKDMKNLSPDLESAKFKYSKKYQFDIFGRAEKIFILFLFIFHLHFSIFKKIPGAPQKSFCLWSEFSRVLLTFKESIWLYWKEEG